MAELYRKSALERISSPEQLDKALKVTSPMSWLALLAVTLIVVVTVIWSIVGTIPVTVTTSGVISSAVSTCFSFAIAASLAVGTKYLDSLFPTGSSTRYSVRFRLTICFSRPMIRHTP